MGDDGETLRLWFDHAQYAYSDFYKICGSKCEEDDFQQFNNTQH